MQQEVVSAMLARSLRTATSCADFAEFHPKLVAAAAAGLTDPLTNEDRVDGCQPSAGSTCAAILGVLRRHRTDRRH
jgi:hypothetical protein